VPGTPLLRECQLERKFNMSYANTEAMVEAMGSIAEQTYNQNQALTVQNEILERIARSLEGVDGSLADLNRVLGAYTGIE